jgi:hypothetical protein
MTCVICNARFEPKNPRRPAQTCSRVCRNKLQWQRVPKRNCGPAPKPHPVCTCAECGEEFVKPKLHRGGIYCSRTCTGRAKAKGGLSYSSDGRLVVKCRDSNHMFYSRALMCGHLGRLLGPDEVVHHINEDPTDDRIENLRIVDRREHAALHRDVLVRKPSILKSQGRA